MKSYRLLALLLACICISITVLIIDCMSPLGIAGGIPYLLVIVLMQKTGSLRLPFYAAALCTALTILGFFFSPLGDDLWKAVVNRAMSTSVLWITAALGVQRERLHREKEQAVSKLKIFKGLLPICASCKMIQDDQEQWHIVEEYVRDHSEAKFTHGLCPDCTTKLYPDL